MDARTDVVSDEYRRVRVVTDKAISDLKAQGAEVVDPVTIPALIELVNKAYDGNVFETEEAVNAYLADRPHAPVRSLRDILLSGKVAPARARTLIANVGRSRNDPGYTEVQRLAERARQTVLTLMADDRLDALVYATFDQPPSRIAPDVMTNPAVEMTGIGNNRRLSPVIGFPAITVPAGFTSDGLPVGLEIMARQYAEPMLFRFAYAYEQATRHRKPPATVPAVRR
jgi:Asp-tRNA(Asn)/Glu-tRNA(Gln) amidotransferase A subunit family amidase